MTEARARTWLGRWRARRTPRNHNGERRQLTVMFVDLVGSTAMAERHEPEQIRDVVRRYRELSGRVITDHHGHIAQYAGDGIMAYFGFPTAREDDARQAVLAGLELLASLDDLDASIRRDHGIELGARVGIHTGLVLVSDITSGVRTEHNAVFGAAPNRAARIQSVAPEGSVVISDDTYEIVRGYFDVESLGTPAMKGIEGTVEVFRVVGTTGAVDRLQAAGITRSPFVGRREERGRVHEHWRAVGEPNGGTGVRLVLVRGEAGIGKSRLAEDAVALATSSGAVVLSAFCAPDRSASPFFPVAGLLERRFGLERTDDVATTIAKIERNCSALGVASPDTIALVAGVLGITPDEAPDARSRDPRARRELTFAALVSLITAEAARTRTLLLVEDLQWADESTLELLARLVAVDPAVGLLIVATARPDFDATPLGASVDTIALGPLPDADHRALIEELAKVHRVPEPLWDVIAARSDGNPLFTEELAKSIGHPADGATSSEQIPRTIRDLLTARLDALGDQKPLAQAAAVIGRDIDADLLRTIAGVTRRQLTAGLGALEGAGIVETLPEGHPPVTHRFAHSLIRDAAYESQEQPRRRELHVRVAETLCTQAGVDPGLVAQHFDAGHVAGEAVTWYLLAGVSAQTAAADAEAIRLLDRGLELVDGLPEGDARDTQEFNARVVRGTSHVNTKGYGTQAAADDYGRGLELSERVGAVADIVPATAAIWAYYLVHGDLAGAAEAIVRLDEMRRPEFEAEILCCEGVQRLFEGRIAEARTLLEASVQVFHDRAPETEESRRWLLPNDSAAVAMTHLGCVLWLVGEPSAAQQQLDAAAARARSLPAYPTGAFTQAYVASYAAWVEILAARFANGRALHEQTTAIAERYGMLFWIAAGRSGHAIGCGYLGEPASAIADLAPAMELWRSLGAEAFLPFVVTQRAQLRLMTGEPEAALADVDLALDIAARTTEHFFTAEAHRLRAAILLALDPSAVDAARAELETARTLAHDQGAIVFELRAAIDRAELDAADERRRDTALATLRGALSQVPAGGELADVDRARAFLAG